MTERELNHEEVTQRGQVLYEERVRPNVDEKVSQGKFAAIDIETGTYEVDADKWAAGQRLKARRPDALIYFTRIGLGYAHHLAPRLSEALPCRTPLLSL